MLGTAATASPPPSCGSVRTPAIRPRRRRTDDARPRRSPPTRWRCSARRSLERFGAQLPFLLKVLAADTALSIQVHPNLEQARAGFAAEQRDELPADERNYTDANHKPELLCALTPFEALCGFAPLARTRALLDALALPELAFLADALAGPDPLRAAFTAVLTTTIRPHWPTRSPPGPPRTARGAPRGWPRRTSPVTSAPSSPCC